MVIIFEFYSQFVVLVYDIEFIMFHEVLLVLGRVELAITWMSFVITLMLFLFLLSDHASDLQKKA